ncbi:hypothetical protein MKZ38_006991 [Zalerion maritima]|uniref:Uncharacterized protein n=1 Tax=Zalerion maritima TaxID=339359 RepID=A0AAD5WNH2_9PEZI|nr:hypothetical protein MKZ38_006991 [Zalerion maritima]
MRISLSLIRKGTLAEFSHLEPPLAWSGSVFTAADSRLLIRGVPSSSQWSKLGISAQIDGLYPQYWECVQSQKISPDLPSLSSFILIQNHEVPITVIPHATSILQDATVCHVPFYTKDNTKCLLIKFGNKDQIQCHHVMLFRSGILDPNAAFIYDVFLSRACPVAWTYFPAQREARDTTQPAFLCQAQWAPSSKGPIESSTMQ